MAAISKYHPFGLEQDLAGELRNLGRHGRRKELCLPLIRQHRHDLTHVADEAHVEHAVGLVDDEVFALAQIGAALLREIEKPARRGNQNVDAAAQRLDLGPLGDAAHDDRLAELQVPPIGLDAAGDL